MTHFLAAGSKYFANSIRSDDTRLPKITHLFLPKRGRSVLLSIALIRAVQSKDARCALEVFEVVLGLVSFSVSASYANPAPGCKFQARILYMLAE